MKRLILSLLTMASMASYAQVYHNTVTFGSGGIENVTTSSLYQENRLITGGLYQSSFQINGETLPFNGGNADAFFIRYNEEGEIDMVKTFGGWADDAVTAVTEDLDGNIYITGYFQGKEQGGIPFDADPSEEGKFILNQKASMLTRDLFLVKLNATGDFLWAKQISNTEYAANEDANAIVVDHNGGLYLAGSFAQADFNTGGADSLPNIVVTKSGKHEGFLVKLEAETGNFVWLKHYYGGECSFESMVIDHENQNIIAGGQFKKKFSPDNDSITYNSEGTLYNGFLTNVSFEGEVNWTRHWGGQGNVITDNVTLLENGDIFTAGRYNKLTSLNPDNIEEKVEAKGQYDIWWSKFDNEGNFVFNNSFGGKGYENMASIQQDINGNILLVATFSDTATFTNSQSAMEFIPEAGTDILMMNLSQDGELLSHLTIGGAEAYGSLDAFINTNGDILMSGGFRGTVDFNPFEGEDFHTSGGGYDGFFSTFIWEAVTGVTEYNKPSLNISVYPNPVQETIYLQGATIDHFQIFNTQGRIIKEGSVMSQEIGVDDLSKGTYLLKVSNNQGASASQIILKK